MRNRRLKFAAGLILFVGSFSSLKAQDFGAGNRSLSIDSRYFYPEYSNRAHAQFGIDLIHAASLPGSLLLAVDTTSGGTGGEFLFYKKSQWKNLGNGFVTLVGSIFLANGYVFSYHEFGHGTRAASAGFKPFFGHGFIGSEEDLDAAINSGQLKDNFFSFWLSSITNTGGFSIATGDVTLFTPLDEDEFVEFGIQGLAPAGGLNNEMYFTEAIEDHLRREGGHIGFWPSYAMAKLAATSYEEGETIFNDVFNVTTYYEQLGYDVNREDIDRGSLRSFLLSGTTYQLGFQIVRMFAGMSTHFQSWSWHGVEIPNTAFYMTTAGLSHKVRTGFRYGPWRFPIDLEHVYAGETRTEVTVGAERRIGRFFASTAVTVGNVVEPRFDLRYRAHRNLQLSGGYTYYNPNNLNGERHIPSLENRSDFHEVYVGIAVVY
jgi:hypothetical protein